MHTQESLDKLTKSNLVKLGEYLGTEKLNMRMLKGEMIEKILNYVSTVNVVEEEPQMSVRIRRIRESQE
jgi:hypothetical protein